jgi:hypothetical protein
MLLRDYNAKVDKEHVLKPSIENESLYEINEDNGSKAASFDTFQNITVRSTTLTHRNVHKCT